MLIDNSIYYRDLTEQEIWKIVTHAKSLSRCFSRQIGAALVYDNRYSKSKRLLSIGWNGPPVGISSCKTRNKNLEKKCPRQVMGYKSGAGLKYCPAVHAERSAILHSAKFGNVVAFTTLYMTCGIPCKDCLIEIIEAGVIELVCVDINSYYDELSKDILKESDLRVREWNL